jgi:chromosome segregation ATPase
MSSLTPIPQNDILAILQHEQEHALSLLSLSPLLSSLFVSYASRAGARGSSSTTSAESEEWKVLQDTIASVREENERLKLETREMVRKVEMSEASQEMLRSQVSSLNEANAAYQEDLKCLRAELAEAKKSHDRNLLDSDAEKTALKVQISDLEVSLELF